MSLRTAIRDGLELCRRLDLPPRYGEAAARASRNFPVFAPLSFVARMRPGDPHDPLLRQVLPLQASGRASLVTLALLKADVPPDAPELKTALSQIAARVSTDGRFDVSGDHNYDAAVTLMALANADPVKYKRQIQVIANFLIERQTTEGGWDYPPGHGAAQGTGVEANSASGLGSSHNADDAPTEGLTPIRIQVEGEYARTYVGANRTANMPNAVLPRSEALHFENIYFATEEEPIYLGPIRVATFRRR